MSPDTNLTGAHAVDERADTPDLTSAASAAGPVAESGDLPARDVVFDVSDLSVYYGAFRAVRDVNIQVGSPGTELEFAL